MKQKLAFIAYFLSVAVLLLEVVLSSQNSHGLIATHFGISGRANGWTSPFAFSSLMFLMGLGSSLFVIGICYAIRFFPASTLNVPDADYWRSEAHYPEACRFLYQHSFWFGAIQCIFFAVIDHQIIEANHFQPPILHGDSLVMITGAFLLAIIIWAIFIWRFFSNKPTTL